MSFPRGSTKLAPQLASIGANCVLEVSQNQNKPSDTFTID